MKKRLRQFTALITMCALALVGVCSCAARADFPGANDTAATVDVAGARDESGQIQLLEAGFKLPEDMMTARIKADYLLKNEGYSDGDEVVAILSLSDDALIDRYLSSSVSADVSLADYAKSADGRSHIAALEEKQSAVIAELTAAGLIDEVNYRYDTIADAIAVTTTYGDFKKLEGRRGISSASLADTFARPQSAAADASAIVNPVDVYETGIFNSGSVDYTGKGTAVAILDSGFDCSHEVFSRTPEGDLLLGRDKVADLLKDTNAKKTTESLDVSNVWYSEKIPFVYDYADKDCDVFPHDSEHGTHVAGIIGGYSDSYTNKDGEEVRDSDGNPIPFRGVAQDTQLVLLKVFPDFDDGAETDDILAALEDAVLLNVDAINMSLGSSCGFAREKDGDVINTVYDKVNESGISLLTAASNSYSSGFGGEQGNTNFVTNPDSGTVGAPSTYAPALSVASISGTKSKYIVCNDTSVVFFNESNSIEGKENDFFGELYAAQGKDKSETLTMEYVTIPGYGYNANYTMDVRGKIALVRRGDNTFEEKARIAAIKGAAACIIYNNIDGDILMSMGKSDHIPTISISKDDGEMLASRPSGTMLFSYDDQAGPFMSDFSSWGPLPDLTLKPEITAHGGNIMSGVPGGGYDELSGTSMATPNLCGIVVLIRQFLKEQPRYAEYDWKQISVLTNQMLMSTATIILNQEGRPYSPRKQGAGLASLYNVVNTKTYITVNGIDRTKLELKDDPNKNGVYNMDFNVVNVADTDATYDLSLVGMTESVSAFDEEHVSEKDQLLEGGFVAEKTGGDGTLNGNKVTVPAGKTLSIGITYTLSARDKDLIDSLFPYGMYVEGFVKLEATEESGIDINVPFLAFYGDWTKAPIFDKTYYEVESEAHDLGIDEEDKIKADYFATTPYGSYYYNYIIPLGTYLYDIDLDKYDAIPATEDHIAVSDVLGAIDGIETVYAGMLRCAKTMDYTIVDQATGEVIFDKQVVNSRKAFSQGGSPIPNYEELEISSADLGLVNNRRYTFEMAGKLDYGDGGVKTNVRNTFGFDFVLDNESPIIRSCKYEKEYDRTQRKDRYYLTMTVYDNQYAMSITPMLLRSEGNTITEVSYLLDNPIPVYGERGSDTVVRFEITQFLEDLSFSEFCKNGLAFMVDDYALNQNLYLCELPGTRGPSFKFTEDGTMSGLDKVYVEVFKDEVVDLTDFLASDDPTLDADKDYLKYLVWASSDENVARVEEGKVVGVNSGVANITVKEVVGTTDFTKTATIIVTVSDPLPSEEGTFESASGTTIDSLRFAYFDTDYAFPRSGSVSDIGDTGDRNFISSVNGRVSMFPGEMITLEYDIDPWYVRDNHEAYFASTNEAVATVSDSGQVIALKEGSTTITLRVDGSSLMASLPVTVKNPFIIENRTLTAYKGVGGTVEIPDDEGILYIGSFAFCLFETDYGYETKMDEDFDANKLPQSNITVTEVVVPEGVENIERYAFYNCSKLHKVELPSSIKFVRDHAFYNDVALDTINLGDVEAIGEYAFYGCEKLAAADLSHTYSVGAHGFDGCAALGSLNLRALRNTGEYAFANTAGLTAVQLGDTTKLSERMFYRSGLTAVELREKGNIPAYAFAECKNLGSVTFANALLSIGDYAFANCTALNEFTLPSGAFAAGKGVLSGCTALKTLTFAADTEISGSAGLMIAGTKVDKFDLTSGNTRYKLSSDRKLLLDSAGERVVLAVPVSSDGEYAIPAGVTKIGSGAFSGAAVSSITIPASVTEIEDYAFSGCESLSEVTFTSDVKIDLRAFSQCTALSTVNGMNLLTDIGNYAFAETAVENVGIKSGATIGEGAFFKSGVKTLTIGEGATLGMGAFQRCTSLNSVTLNGEIEFGDSCFAYDTALREINLEAQKTIVDGMFSGCKSLESVNLAAAVVIKRNAFFNCAGLRQVTLGAVVEIGEAAFAGDTDGVSSGESNAPHITHIIFPATLTTIGDGAFMNAVALEEVALPESVTSLGAYAFASCPTIYTVTLPSGLTEIKEYAFSGAVSLVSVNLENVKTIGIGAFMSAQSLETADLSSAVIIDAMAFADTSLSGSIAANELTEIGSYAFQSAHISSFTAGKLKRIGFAAFMGNNRLTSFTFSADVEEIGAAAFYNCASLASFASPDGSGTVKINDYAELIDGLLYIKNASGRRVLYAVPAGLNAETLIVAEGTVRVERYAGNSNALVKRIILPDSLESIGNYAFYGYTGLTEVEFRSVSAPALENWYEDGNLSEESPGYDTLHDQFDLFGYELTYSNFVALLGAKSPIAMVIPANADDSYDAVPYLVYFGGTEAATRSTYVAMETAMRNFVRYAGEVAEIEEVTTADRKLIENAMTAMNAVKQDYKAFGYTDEQWTAMTEKVTAAHRALARINVNNAKKAVRDVQAKIDALPERYDGSAAHRALVEEIRAAEAALDRDDRRLLITDRLESLEAQIEAYGGSGSGSGGGKTAAIVGGVVGGVAGAAVIAGVIIAVIVVRRKKKAE